MDARGILLFHADRGAAAPDIACDGVDVLDVEHRNGFFPDGSCRLFHVELLRYGYDEHEIVLAGALCDQGFVDFFVRQAEHVRDLNGIYELVTLVGVCLVWYFFRI